MKKKHTPLPKTPAGPTQVILPNTTAEKMRALVHCAAALEELAKALNSVNVAVTVANCHFTSADGPALTIGQ